MSLRAGNVNNVLLIGAIVLTASIFTLSLSYSNEQKRSVKIVSKNYHDKKIALVIGNSRYKESPLRNPANDASDIAAVLTGLGFRVTLLVDANRLQIDKAITQFGRDIKGSEVGLFYFAGHGIQVSGINYLMPIGSTIEAEDEIAAKAIDANTVLRKMESAGSPVNIVFLDACRNNPFARSFRSSSKGLAPMDAPKGTIIVYATSPGSVAADGSGQNGIFTKHLLANIRTPNSDIEIMLKKVKQGVLKETHNKQTPWSLSSLTGEFYFDRHGTSKPTTEKSDSHQPGDIRNPDATGGYPMFGDVEVLGLVKEGERFFVLTATGEGSSGDAVTKRATAQKSAMKKIKNAMLSGFSLEPYLYPEDKILAMFENGEIIDLEYTNDGSAATVKFRVSVK